MRSPGVWVFHCWCLFAVASSPAQALVHRDPSQLAADQAVFDPIRGRLVVGAGLGETWECDGSEWFRREAVQTSWASARLCWAGGSVFAFAGNNALQGESWSYDGFDWRQGPRPGQPPARRSAMLAYDSGRGRAVLFGGEAMVGPNYQLNDTWEWNGTAWTHLAPAVSPPWLRKAGFAYDPVRQVSVLFGGDGATGVAQGTWEWNGAQWTQRNPATRPAARTGPAMTFDPVLGRIVLHGGLTLAGLQGDLWSFDGVNWQPIATGNPGPAAYQHTLHHDPRTNELWALAGIPAELWILGGGTWRSGPALPFVATAGPTQATVDPGTGGVLRCGWGTQVWDRVQWRSITTQPAPPGRIFAAMWNDGTYAWLFGGWNTLLGITYNDTWRWDGVSWMQVGGPSPAIRHDTAVAYDSVRGEAVLFGGFTQSALSDTWTFDGAAWHFQNPATRPPVRWQHGMAFDLARGRMVLFGGTGLTLSQLRNDTWEWDGVNWAQVVTPVSPPAVGTAALCFDHRHQRIVMSQSGTQNVAAWTPDLWTYDGVTWTPLAVAPALPLQPVHSWMTLPGELDPTVVDGSSVQLLTDRPPIVTKLGTGCGSQPPDLWVRTPPRLGASQFAFEIEHAPASQVVALLLATAPGSLVVGGCSIGVHAGGSALFLATDARGAAMSPLPLPAGPALLGVSVFAQAFALAPGSTNGFTASATVRASIGMR